MLSELKSLKQRITELETENTEIRKKNTKIFCLRNKLSVSNTEIVELKCKNAKVLKVNGKYNEMYDAEKAKLKARIKELKSEFRDRITKVEQKQTLNEPRV